MLLENIDKIQTTDLGEARMRENLNLAENINVVEYTKKMLRRPQIEVKRNGKNYYARYQDKEITINSSTFNIITAHVI